jgi:hypothetical protein
MRCDILESPLQILMSCQLSRQCPTLLATQAQEAIIDRQHRPVIGNDFSIVMIRSESKNT